MAIAQQYLKPQNQAPQWMPQGYGNDIQNKLQQGQPQQQQGWGDSLKKFWSGSPGYYEQQPTNYHPGQMRAFDALLNSGMQTLQNPYEGFDALSQDTMNQYFQEIMPRIQEQYASQHGGSTSSPDFQSRLSSGATGLSALLNAQKTQYGMANKRFGFEQAQAGLTPQYESIYNEGEAGYGSDIMKFLAQTALAYATGGSTGAPAVAELFEKGVNAAGKYMGSKGSGSKNPIPQQSRSQYDDRMRQQQQNERAIARNYPSAVSGYGQTYLEPF